MVAMDQTMTHTAKTRGRRWGTLPVRDPAQLLLDGDVELAELDAEGGRAVGVQPDDLALDLDVVDRLLHGADPDAEGGDGQRARGKGDVADLGAAERHVP